MICESDLETGTEGAAVVPEEPSGTTGIADDDAADPAGTCGVKGGALS